MGFLDETKSISILRKLFYFSLAAVVILEFFLIKNEHIEFSLEHIAELPVFHAVYGFIACLLIVLTSWVMGLLIMKGEDYYD